mmetsp:Transcript_10291/g.43012  ORF Transcript_10291/g.43012 Transcript_10291/m.43012 type:complete len:83 (+) Transcript_10291:164-412(+)
MSGVEKKESEDMQRDEVLNGPVAPSDFMHPERFPGVKKGNLRRTWSFLNLNILLNRATKDCIEGRTGSTLERLRRPQSRISF